MKRIISIVALLTTSISSFACTCASVEDIITETMAKWQEIAMDDVQISSVETTITPLALKTFIKSFYSCDDGCSLMGTRVTATVEYEKNGNICSAQLTKPASYELRLSLSHISCESL